MSIAWRLFLGYLLVALVGVGSLGIYLGREIDRNYLRTLEQGLRGQAVLIGELLGPKAAAEAQRTRTRTLVTEAARRSGLRVSFIAADGTVLADSESDPATMENHAARPEVKTALSTGSGSSIRHSRTLGVDMLYLAVATEAAEPPSVVRVALPLSAVTDTEGRLRARLWLASLGAAMLALVVSLGMSRRPIGSLRRLTAAAASLAAGDLEVRVPARGRDEIAALARSFNHMAEHTRQTVQALREERRRAETILTHMGEAILVTDAAGRVVLCNPAFERTFAVERAQVVGLTVTEATRSSALDDAFRAALGGELATAEARLPFPRQLVLEAVVTSLGEGGRLGAVGVLHDVTQLRRLETVRREFVANASHELQTPITAIKAMTETLLTAGKEDVALRDRFLADLEKEAERLGALVRDLLDLTAIEDGQPQLMLRPISVVAAAALVAGHLQSLADQRGITLARDVPAELGVLADRTALTRVLANLLDNAINYTDAGGRVGIEARPEDGRVAITIWDTGLGVPSTDLDRIFERFYRVDKARSREHGGTGLGLSIVKHLTEAMEGEVRVESELGRGSRFTVRLPAVPFGAEESGAR